MALSLHTLKPARGAKHRRKRIGRGNASGHGTYSTRGQKGQRSRSGGRRGLRTMGVRRLVLSTPKLRGFKSHRPKPVVVNVGTIDRAVKAGEVVTRERLVTLGIIERGTLLVKVLGDGEVTKAMSVKGIAVSAGAREKIQKAGGSVE